MYVVVVGVFVCTCVVLVGREQQFKSETIIISRYVLTRTQHI